jgi:hypothetical protein
MPEEGGLSESWADVSGRLKRCRIGLVPRVLPGSWERLASRVPSADKGLRSGFAEAVVKLLSAPLSLSVRWSRGHRCHGWGAGCGRR